LTLALTTPHEAQPVKAPIPIELVLPKETKQPDFNIEVLEPLRATQKAEADKLAAEEAERVRQAEEARQAAYTNTAPVYTPTYSYGGSLFGSRGYAIPGGNCVNEPGVNNPRTGNPISWAVTSQTPRIGATVLFYFNHVAVVTGVWSNGDIEVRHQNVTGGITRYPRSQIRGFR
jgi:hypothetical protein